MRNTVLVTVDSLRADHVAPYADVETTPELEELADDGVVYERSIAPGPSTPQSMPAIWTGSYPTSAVDGDVRDVIERHVDTRTTLAERFSQSGYSTAAFTPNPFTSRHYGFDEGFDTFEDFLDSESRIDRLRSRVVTRWMEHGSTFGIRFALNMLGVGDLTMSWESYYDRIVEWVDRAPEPWFLWIFLLEPHWPYRPPRRHRDSSILEMYRANLRRAPATDSAPSAEDRERLLRLYEGTIRHVDEFIGRIRREFDDPIVAVHGDHGEGFGEHGEWGHGSVGFDGPLFEENVRVPLVIGNVDQETIERPLSLRSLGDILISAAGGDPDWSEFSRRWVVTKSATVGLRGSDWKFLKSADESRAYALQSDPGERTPLSDGHPLVELGERLAAAFQESQSERERLERAAESVSEHSGRL